MSSSPSPPSLPAEKEKTDEDARKEDILTDPMDGNPSESWTSQFARLKKKTEKRFDPGFNFG